MSAIYITEADVDRLVTVKDAIAVLDELFASWGQLSTWNIPRLAPGRRVRVTQMIAGRAILWETRAEGEVISCEAEPTGSWYAHGKNDKLWLLRLRLRKPDGEITTLALDHNSRLELLD